VPPQDTETTFRYERWRAVTGGILETAGATFLLLIAVKHFEAGATAKALIASGGSFGLLLSPFVVSRVEAWGCPTAKAASRAAAFGAACLLVMAAVPVVPVFVVGSVLAMASASAVIPLMTQVYQENYPEGERGRLFSKALIVRIGTAALFSELAGRALAADLGKNFRGLLLVFAAAFALGSWCLSRVPSRPLVSGGGSTHPLRALRFAREDRLFRLTLISWMFLGVGNLMMYPLRVEYLANPRHGLALDVGTVALIVGVIPNAARLVMSPLWGWLFDRMNFFALRMTLNFGFAVGVFAFFMSDSFAGLAVGAVIYGVSNAGGDVAWSLWVTKFAPPERVADYMSVHTFFTGLRGVVAPMLGFWLVQTVSMQTLGAICAGLIFCSLAVLFPEVKAAPKPKEKAAALVEEVSE